MALIWIHMQRTGAGHPAFSVKLKNLTFIVEVETAVMIVSGMTRFMRKE